VNSQLANATFYRNKKKRANPPSNNRDTQLASVSSNSSRDADEARSVRGRGRGQSGLTINAHIDDRNSKYD